MRKMIVNKKIKKIRVNYRIEKNLKERIKSNGKYKNLSHFVREAVRDFLKSSLSIEELHTINEKIKNIKLITTTVLLFEQDIENINKIRNVDETYEYEMIYLLTIAVYNYCQKEGLI